MSREKTDWVAWALSDEAYHLPWIINCEQDKNGEVDVWHTGGPGGHIANFSDMDSAKDCCNMTAAVVEMAQELKELRLPSNMTRLERQRAELQGAAERALAFFRDMQDWLPMTAEKAGWKDEDIVFATSEVAKNVTRLAAALGEDLKMDPGWTRIGRFDSVRRRSVWVRIDDDRIELRGGREGDDAHVIIYASDPAYGPMKELLSRQIWSQET